MHGVEFDGGHSLCRPRRVERSRVLINQMSVFRTSGPTKVFDLHDLDNKNNRIIRKVRLFIIINIFKNCYHCPKISEVKTR